MADADPDPEAVREILRYFVRNPQAADDLEGIARWRLLDELVTRRLEQTERALDWLVARGFLYATVTAGSRPIFSSNPDKAAEAREFLAAPAPPGSREKA